MPNDQNPPPLELPDESKVAVAKRLRRIEGQVRGLQKMVDDRRACADVLVQIASVQEALRGVGKMLLQHHLAVSVAAALRAGDMDLSESTLADLVALWGK